MAKLGDPTDFSYRVNKVTKVIDGDTIDVIIDLGFDIMYKSRVRLFGIDTPESRTRDLVEKKYGLMSKDFLKDKGHRTVPQLYWNDTHLNKLPTTDLTYEHIEAELDYENYIGGVENWSVTKA